MSRQSRKNKSSRGKQLPRSVTEKLGAIDSLKPAWRFYRFDYGGPWGTKTLTAADMSFDKLIMGHLSNFETMTWGEIKNSPKGRGKGNKHHFINVDSFKNPEARKRLKAIKLSHLEELFSLRLSGKTRVFGNLKTGGMQEIGGVLEILWYDPDHSIS